LLPVVFASAFVGNGDDFDGFGIGRQAAIDEPMRLPMNFPSQRAVTTSQVGAGMLEDVGNLGPHALNEPMAVLFGCLSNIGHGFPIFFESLFLEDEVHEVARRPNSART
jgi:hypothetical protein